MLQSNEVGSSNACELEGLKRTLKFLEDKGITKEKIGTFITDRHKGINKHLRENLSETKHYYDTWHVAKGSCVCVEIFPLFFFWYESVCYHQCGYSNAKLLSLFCIGQL